jgi:hypothetical protein
MAITEAVVDELLKDYEKPDDLLGQNGLLKQLQKRHARDGSPRPGLRCRM